MRVHSVCCLCVIALSQALTLPIIARRPLQYLVLPSEQLIAGRLSGGDYIMEITIGESVLNVSLDTGSSELNVACESFGGNVSAFYNCQHGFPYCQPAIGHTCTPGMGSEFSEGFADHTGLVGQIFTDTVTFAANTNFAVTVTNAYIGGITNNSNPPEFPSPFFKAGQGNSDGILGLAGYSCLMCFGCASLDPSCVESCTSPDCHYVFGSQLPLMPNLFAQDSTIINFGLYLCPVGPGVDSGVGQFVVGDATQATDLYTGEFEWVQITAAGFYGVNVLTADLILSNGTIVNLTYGGAPLEGVLADADKGFAHGFSTNNNILDSGWSGVGMWQGQIWDAVVAVLKANGFTGLDGVDIFAGGCGFPSAPISQWPIVRFYLEGVNNTVVTLSVPPAAYITGDFCPGVGHVSMSASRGALDSGTRFGNQVIAQYFVVFDPLNYRVGFASPSGRSSHCPQDGNSGKKISAPDVGTLVAVIVSSVVVLALVVFLVVRWWRRRRSTVLKIDETSQSYVRVH